MKDVDQVGVGEVLDRQAGKVKGTGESVKGGILRST